MSLLHRLAAWNPWWVGGHVPDALVGRPRGDLTALLGDLDGPRVLLLTGIRRSGKSTFLYQLIAELIARGVEPARILYVNLEDLALQDDSLSEIIAAHRQGHAPVPPRYLFLDEVQTRPEWARFARVVVDRKEDRIAATGSTASLLAGEAGSLLTGRHITTEVRPLGFGEFLAFHDLDVPSRPEVSPQHADALVHHLDQFLRVGGFPEANLEDPHRARRLLQHHFTDILQRDLVVSQGLDPTNVRRLGVYLVRTFARPHSKSALQRATGLSRNAIRDYVDAMRNAYLLQSCTRFSWSPKPQVAEQAPVKYYLSDPGMREAIAGPGDVGRLAQNAVANALTARDLPLMYWSEGKGEVDFVVPLPDGKVDAVQVTYGDKVPAREVRALEALWQALPATRRGQRVILTRAEQGEMEGVPLVPLWRWLLFPTGG